MNTQAVSRTRGPAGRYAATALGAMAVLALGAYAPVAATAAITVMAIGIASVVLLVVKQSWPYYARPATAPR